MPNARPSSRRPRPRREPPGPIAFEVELPLSHEIAIERVSHALKAEGFGVITRIDAHTTFQEKLGVTFPPYTILGACNPALAHQALSTHPESGLLLPCNVTVEHTGPDQTLVRIQDPSAMLTVGPLGSDRGMRSLMKEARTRLLRVARELTAHAHTLAL